MAGLTPEGLSIKTLNEVISDLGTTAQQVFADVTQEGEVVNVEENSTLGRIIGVAAPSSSDIWEAIQEVYDAFNPNSATGISLDNLVALGGVSRLSESATRANVIVTGNTNITLPAGSKVSSSTTGKMYSLPLLAGLSANNATGVGVSIVTLADSTLYTVGYRESLDLSPTLISVTSGIGATMLSLYAQFEAEIALNHPQLKAYQKNDRLFIESVDQYQLFSFTSSVNLGIVKVVKPVLVVGDEVGPFEQPVNTIDTIATPVFGWDEVYNPVPATVGNYLETDEELRQRFRNTKFEKATNVIESLYSSILNLNGIEDLKIYENDTNVVDSNGVNGHSFLTIVEGGLGTEIAQAIWDNKPIGILSQGNTTVTVFDTQGLPHDVSFSRPTKVNTYVSLNITKDSNFPQDGEDKIKSAIIAYIDSLKIGDDVIYSRLYTPINSVPGFQVNSLFLGGTPSPVSTSNLVINFDQICNINTSFITITET